MYLMQKSLVTKQDCKTASKNVILSLKNLLIIHFISKKDFHFFVCFEPVNRLTTYELHVL